jgi:hypothetical protein
MSRTFTLSVAVNTIAINAGYALMRRVVVVALTKKIIMDQITLNTRAAYVLGYYHGLYEGYTPNNPFMDQYYAHYRRGYDDAIKENMGVNP